VETTRTSQTKLPAGERKDNSSSWLLIRLTSDIEGRLRQRDRRLSRESGKRGEKGVYTL